MAWTVWKFPLALADVQEVRAPLGARWLHVGLQDGVLTVWGWVANDRRERSYQFYVVGTGHPAPPVGTRAAPTPGGDTAHVGTVLDGPFVWHVFAEAAE